MSVFALFFDLLRIEDFRLNSYIIASATTNWSRVQAQVLETLIEFSDLELYTFYLLHMRSLL